MASAISCFMANIAANVVAVTVAVVLPGELSSMAMTCCPSFIGLVGDLVLKAPAML